MAQEKKICPACLVVTSGDVSTPWLSPPGLPTAGVTRNPVMRAVLLFSALASTAPESGRAVVRVISSTCSVHVFQISVLVAHDMIIFHP